jgi:hypothetical protein
MVMFQRRLELALVGFKQRNMAAKAIVTRAKVPFSRSPQTRVALAGP